MAESLYNPELHKLRSYNSHIRIYMVGVEPQRVVHIVQGDTYLPIGQLLLGPPERSGVISVLAFGLQPYARYRIVDRDLGDLHCQVFRSDADIAEELHGMGEHTEFFSKLLTWHDCGDPDKRVLHKGKTFALRIDCQMRRLHDM